MLTEYQRPLCTYPLFHTVLLCRAVGRCVLFFRTSYASPCWNACVMREREIEIDRAGRCEDVHIMRRPLSKLVSRVERTPVDRAPLCPCGHTPSMLEFQVSVRVPRSRWRFLANPYAVAPTGGRYLWFPQRGQKHGLLPTYAAHLPAIPPKRCPQLIVSKPNPIAAAHACKWPGQNSVPSPLGS